jgi:hypothetical protein
MNNKLVLTSYGLTTGVGRKNIGKELANYDLVNKKIFLFHEPHYPIETILIDVCCDLGFKRENVILSGQQDSINEIIECDFYYCTEGNTFEVLSLMRERGVDRAIKTGFDIGNKLYIGASAGAAIAGTSIEEIINFDRNFSGMTDFAGLSLFDGIIIPHYTKTELKRYIKNSPGIEDKYKRILSVANKGCVILEM